MGEVLSGLWGRLSGYLAWADIVNVKMVFLSIVIEALPFLLLGTLVSAVLNNFVSDETVRRILPRSLLGGLVSASLLGVVFPLCDCGIVPIARRLVLKGVPLPLAVAFMLSAPTINPVVAVATASAFNGSWFMAWLRLGTAFAVAVLTGLALSFIFRNTQFRAGINLQHHGCTHGHGHRSGFGVLAGTLRDACDEFFSMSRYLLLGSFCSAAVQVFVPRATLLGIGQDPVLSIAVMMLFAFGVSVCSAADAFVAASLASSFTLGSLLAFMVFGPMIDLKNVLMLWRVFRWRLVVVLALVVALLCGGAAYLVNFIMAGVI